MWNYIIAFVFYGIANIILKTEGIDIFNWKWHVISISIIIASCTICDKPIGKRN